MPPRPSPDAQCCGVDERREGIDERSKTALAFAWRDSARATTLTLPLCER
jgi:hypothetical protein